METIFKIIGILIRSKELHGIDGRLSSGASITSSMLPPQAEVGRETIFPSSHSRKKAIGLVITGLHLEYKLQAEPPLCRQKSPHSKILSPNKRQPRTSTTRTGAHRGQKVKT